MRFDDGNVGHHYYTEKNRKLYCILYSFRSLRIRWDKSLVRDPSENDESARLGSNVRKIQQSNDDERPGIGTCTVC
jgi:hypothetical protein